VREQRPTDPAPTPRDDEEDDVTQPGKKMPEVWRAVRDLIEIPPPPNARDPRR
jgi:hypothetical protein